MKKLTKDQYIAKLKKEGKYNPQAYFKKKEQFRIDQANIPDCCKKCKDKQFNKDTLFCGNIACNKPMLEFEKEKYS